MTFVLAVSEMDATVRMLFFAAAVLLFVLAALSVAVPRVALVPAGLAAFVIPFWWDALAAT